MKAVIGSDDVLASLGEPAARTALRARLSSRESFSRPSPAAIDPAVAPPVGTEPVGTEPVGTEPASTEPVGTEPASAQPAAPSTPHGLAAPSPQAQAEQQEHDRYFEVERSAGQAAEAFVAGLVLAHLAVQENCEAMGVTLLDEPEWDLLFGGLRALADLTGAPSAAAGDEGAGPPAGWVPKPPSPAGYRAGYDPGQRWLAGHQLFFSLIQGAIAGLNCFAAAAAAGQWEEADQGLRLAAAFLRSSAGAMKLASDFTPADYDRTVRPAMAPPKVRAGFSGLQTRDHAYLVRLFGALKPLFPALSRSSATYREFTESVVAAYAAHEFICARFRGDVLPSLRMAAASRGKTQRSGTETIREMMRARLALVDHGSAGSTGQP